MSAATIFKMPAAFARDNYPIVREVGTPAARPSEGRTASASDKSATSSPSRGEHQVTTEFRSLLVGRRTATA